MLSFYKEVLADDTQNYITERARLECTSVWEVYTQLVTETVQSANRVRGALRNDKARQAWDSYTRGYIDFHFQDPRYRLHELSLD